MKLWRHIILYMLSATVMLQSASLLLIDTSFKANHEYIAAVLCVNRDKPQMHCDGKCQLKKDINTEQDRESAQKSLSPVSLQLFYDDSPASHHFFCVATGKLFPAVEVTLPGGFCFTNERPPTA